MFTQFCHLHRSCLSKWGWFKSLSSLTYSSMSLHREQSNKKTNTTNVKWSKTHNTSFGPMQSSEWSDDTHQVWQLSSYFQYKWFVADLLSIRPTTLTQREGCETVYECDSRLWGAFPAFACPSLPLFACLSEGKAIKPVNTHNQELIWHKMLEFSSSGMTKTAAHYEHIGLWARTPQD